MPLLNEGTLVWKVTLLIQVFFPVDNNTGYMLWFANTSSLLVYTFLSLCVENKSSNSSVWVTGVRFQSGTPGLRELCFTYLKYDARVTVEVMAGNPAELQLVSGPEQVRKAFNALNPQLFMQQTVKAHFFSFFFTHKPLQVINGHGIPKPFLVQLYDEWGNHTSDQRVRVEVQPSSALKVTTADAPQPVDTEGKSSFTVTSVSGQKWVSTCYYHYSIINYISHLKWLLKSDKADVPSWVLLPCCSTRGYYQLEFKGSFNNKPIPGPTVNLTVLPDPNKPVTLNVEYNTAAALCAGGLFPGSHPSCGHNLHLFLTSYWSVIEKQRVSVCFLCSVSSDCGVWWRNPNDKL